ncbi:MAG: cell division protein ZapA [Chitinophagales bacterium]|nr:cell division protein ZapA [Chitinophagales bacterium]
MEKEKKSIKVVLLDRQYKLQVFSDEQDIVNEAIHEINKAVLAYQEKYPAQDKQDLLTMLFLHQKVDMISKKRAGENVDWNERLDALNELLTKSLSNQ